MSPTPEVPAVAVPDKGTDCGLPVASSLTLTAADFAPTKVGEKVTLMLHVAPAASEVPQFWVMENWVASGPVIVMLPMFRDTLAAFVTVITEGVLFVPTA